MVKFYTIGCPQCNILKKKLDLKQIEYEIIDNKNIMEQKGISVLPMLEVDEQLLNFKEARAWLESV